MRVPEVETRARGVDGGVGGCGARVAHRTPRIHRFLMERFGLVSVIRVTVNTAFVGCLLLSQYESITEQS